MAAQQPARTSPELRARLHSARANVGITPRPGALPCFQRPPCPLWNAPVNALQQHRQLRRRQADLAVFSGRPNKPAPFKTLGKQAGSLAVPPDNFEQITTPPPKHKQMAGKRIPCQNLLGLCRQSIETPPHVCHARRQPDPCVAWHGDHEESPFNKRANISASKPPPAIIR